nr:selenocysteine-specific translation elongation factor [Bacilli bacterium]
MKDYYILGTAGHIDHGKTALVQALTGHDTDRLIEEKRRGISIDLGFAPFFLDEHQVGIVDVPGHERFIRQMVAGATGIDMVLLCIDAREGVMPQTREHLAIMALLGLSRGIIVLTKCDLVDEQWLAFVTEQVQAELAATFLHDARIVAVSALTMQGIEQLKDEICTLLATVKKKPREGYFRMPIDRAFFVDGFGTVVTGTVWQGEVKVGDRLSIEPLDQEVRIRRLQTHGTTVEQIVAGQRAAIAFPSLTQKIERGMVICTPKAMSETTRIDVRITMLKEAVTAIHHRMRMRFYAGTQEVMGRILLLSTCDEIKPGEDQLAQIELERQIVVAAFDRFILRTYSPIDTVAGGQVIDPHPPWRHRRHQERITEMLMRKEKGTLEDQLLAYWLSHIVISIDQVTEQFSVMRDEAMLVLASLRDRGQAVALADDTLWLSKNRWEETIDLVKKMIDRYFALHRFDLLISKSIFIQLLTENAVPEAVGMSVIALLNERGDLVFDGQRIVRLKESVRLTPLEQTIYDQVKNAMQRSITEPPTIKELISISQGKERLLKDVLQLLTQENHIASIAKDIYVTTDLLEKGKVVASALFEGQGAFTIAEFRDQLGVSRKFAVAILEYFDRIKWTKRQGDHREIIA